MHTQKFFAIVSTVAIIGSGSLPAQTSDSAIPAPAPQRSAGRLSPDEEAQLRAALRQKISELDAQDAAENPQRAPGAPEPKYKVLPGRVIDVTPALTGGGPAPWETVPPVKSTLSPEDEQKLRETLRQAEADLNARDKAAAEREAQRKAEAEMAAKQAREAQMAADKAAADKAAADKAAMAKAAADKAAAEKMAADQAAKQQADAEMAAKQKAAADKAAMDKAAMDKAAADKAAMAKTVADKAAADKAAADLAAKQKADAELAAKQKKEAELAAKRQAMAKQENLSSAGLYTPPPAIMVPGSKEQRLFDLLQLYKADKISPAEYHQQRAKIIAEP